MRRKYSARKRATVYLEESELRAIVEAAGGDGNVSEYMRAKALAGLIAETEPVVVHEKVSKREVRSGVKTCGHGVEVGWRCTLCGGIVK